jgi:hypothetical protein
MPSVNVSRLLELLERIERRLYSIWVQCQNSDICAALEVERQHLEQIIYTLLVLNPMIGEQVSIE